MSDTVGLREQARRRRRERVRKKVRGTPTRPRLSVFKSAKHISGQLIDDIHGHTLAAASSMSLPFRERVQNVEKASGGNVSGAKIVGEMIAEQARALGITQIVFDRNGFLYHGRVKALADGAREAGLEF
ncbi:MAG TPA: 50S ribosomal protein L18 [Gammaproteobacteria bacterium]|nr:50S ribosomal protein L18 [Gammaproteobacteria bacterium]